MIKKVKYTIIASLLILLTGCSAEYNVIIKDNSIQEELNILNDVEKKSDAYSYTFAIEDNSRLYNYSRNGNNASFKYTYSFSDFNKSNFANKCFNAFKAYSKDGYYTIQTGSEFLCSSIDTSDYDSIEYDSLKVKIKVVDYEVVENNADEVNDNVYVWNINTNNINNSRITLQFKEKINETKQEYNKETKESNKKSSFNILYVFIGIGALIGIIILILLYAVGLNKKRNKL